MVVWTRQPDPSTGSGPAGGSYKYDFSAFDRYLEAALKCHDRLWFVALNVWGYEARRDAAQVTVADAAGGKSLMKLPAYGTAECQALWRPLISALRDRLKARGLEGKILFGLPSDAGPPPAHAAMFHNILPGAGWIAESHMHIGGYVYDPAAKASVPVKYNSIVWGGEVPDPGVRRLYGWRHPNDRLTMNFNRAGTECLVLLGYPSPWAFRMWMESTLACGRNGNGRVGGDYWRMGVKLVGGAGSSEAVGGSGGTRFGMYLSSGTGQTGLGNSTSDLFAPAPDGLVSTVRLENAREGNQESEARIFIEKALLDKARPLPADLAARCQHLLDERTNTLRLWAMGASALAPYRWQERNLGLFSAAGEVAKTLSAMPASAPAGATAVR
jgi:plasmid stability protein